MSATATAKSLLPTGQEAMAEVKNLGGLAGGMIAAHALLTMTKKDTVIINGGVAVVGLGVAMKVKNPTLKMLALGVSAYGAIKLLNNVTKEVAAPGTVEGLNGILPESAKAMIRKFIPTLSGMDDVSGSDESYQGTDSDLDGLSLDDLSIRGELSESISSVNGLGEVLELVS